MKKDTSLFLSLIVSLLSVAGSLFFSNFMKLPPCDLCWYQRIFMFSTAVVLATGFLARDENTSRFSLPLVSFGLIIAVYHNFLYYKVINPVLTPCTGGVSCTERQLDLFGFLSIPLMSLLSFSVLLILLLINHRQGKKL